MFSHKPTSRLNISMIRWYCMTYQTNFTNCKFMFGMRIENGKSLLIVMSLYFGFKTFRFKERPRHNLLPLRQHIIGKLKHLWVNYVNLKGKKLLLECPQRQWHSKEMCRLWEPLQCAMLSSECFVVQSKILNYHKFVSGLFFFLGFLV